MISVLIKSTILAKLNQFKFINDKGCWIWTGPYRSTKADYKQAILYDSDGKAWSVPRLSAYLYLELNLDNKEAYICHKNDICEDSRCFNPDHIYIGDAKSNSLDRYKGKCKAGLHDMNPQTTIMVGHRRCADCRNQYKNKWRADRRAKGLTVT